MRPRCGGTRPDTARSVVDLPLPLAPSSVTISPSRTLSDTPSSARRWPYETLRSSISSTSGVLRAAQGRLDHRGAGGDLARRCLRDLSPLVQYDHAVGDAHDQVHVVRDY